MENFVGPASHQCWGQVRKWGESKWNWMGSSAWKYTLPSLLQKNDAETSKVSQCRISRQGVQTSGDNLSNPLSTCLWNVYRKGKTGLFLAGRNMAWNCAETNQKFEREQKGGLVWQYPIQLHDIIHEKHVHIHYFLSWVLKLQWNFPKSPVKSIIHVFCSNSFSFNFFGQSV